MINSQKKVTQRNGFSMSAFLERVLDESEDLSNFPLVVRNNSCDRVQWPVEKLNQAAEKGDWKEVERIRNQLFGAFVSLEGMEE